MNEMWEPLHDLVLALAHDLVFGGVGLCGDTNERLLRAWYERHKGSVEETASAIKWPPPSQEKP